MKHYPGPWEFHPGDELAKARLVAAAPDLLAACRVALGELSGLVEVAKQCGAYQPYDGSPGIDAILAAIAKATGETP